MEFLYLLVFLPFISLVAGLLTAWRYYKKGGPVAFGTAALCALIAFVFWHLFHAELNHLYRIVLLLHSIIAVLLFAKPVHSLPAIWAKYTLAGAALSCLLNMGINALLQQKFFAKLLLFPYAYSIISLLFFILPLLGWLRSRHQSYLNLPRTQTYIWGNVLVFAASWIAFLMQIATLYLNDYRRGYIPDLLEPGRPARILLWTAMEVLFYSGVIGLWLHRVKEPPAGTLPADREEDF